MPPRLGLCGTVSKCRNGGCIPKAIKMIPPCPSSSDNHAGPGKAKPSLDQPVFLIRRGTNHQSVLLTGSI